MKTIIVGLLLMGLAGSALAVDRSDLDLRVWQLTANFQKMQAHPDTAIPAPVLQNARGIILLDRTKAGFLVAFKGGNGVAMVRKGDSSWSPVAFMGASDVSLGLQAGGEKEFYVVLLMDDDATHLLMNPTYQYSGEARATAGDASHGTRVGTSPLKSHVVIYSDRKGLFGGADLSAGGIAPDDKANFIYYGRAYSMGDILFGKSPPATEAGKALATVLNTAAQQGQFSELNLRP